jgi:two-component system sensor histidine kinase YesM
VRVELNTGDEMEYVADGFNKMMERLNDYIDQVYVAQNCQKDAELNALKMQIQPHFLYNTLDVIRMTALEEHDEKSAELLECLAHQLRYVMGEHNERIYLKDELEALREYFIIMKVRYEGRISLHINVANEDQMLVMPKLLLQPVVENAIKHGLREKPGHGTVAISVLRRTDYLQIIVMDDGVGMSEERVQHMQEVLDHPEVGYTDKEKHVSVGMKNVYDRIKLNCGKDYGFTIESVVGMGTIVTYRLPIWEEMEHNVESNNCG